MSKPPVILLIDEKYLAGLLTEELCSDSALTDLQVKAVSQGEDGTFQIVMEPKQETAK